MLIGQHTQNGYVCDDMEGAIAHLQERGLEKDPMIIPVDQIVQTPSGPMRQKMRTAMFWTNGVQFELIEPEIDEAGLYSHTLSAGGPLRFHHICMKVDDWDDFRGRVDRQDFPLVVEGGGDDLRFMYLDARKVFGHYLEYTWMTADIWRQIEAM